MLLPDDAPIKSGTMEICPLEIDDVLRLHPDVVRAKAFPIADAKFGALLGAAIVLREGSSTRIRDLKWFAATHLASHKVPQRILLIAAIPRVPRRALARALGFTSSVRPSSVFGIRREGTGTPLFVVGHNDAASIRASLRSARPVFGIREPEIAQLPPPHTIEHVAAECIHALRRFQPEGPYALAAAESSRDVVIEMARQLEQAGEEIEFVALLKCGNSQTGLRHDRAHSWTGRTLDMRLAGVQ